jgi:hypothetical protein
LFVDAFSQTPCPQTLNHVLYRPLHREDGRDEWRTINTRRTLVLWLAGIRFCSCRQQRGGPSYGGRVRLGAGARRRVDCPAKKIRGGKRSSCSGGSISDRIAGGGHRNRPAWETLACAPGFLVRAMGKKETHGRREEERRKANRPFSLPSGMAGKFHLFFRTRRGGIRG